MLIQQPVAGADVAPERDRAALEDQSRDALSIDGQRDRPAEVHVAEPPLLRGHLGQVLAGQIVLIEDEEVVFEARPEVLELIPLRLLVLRQDHEVVGARAARGRRSRRSGSESPARPRCRRTRTRARRCTAAAAWTRPSSSSTGCARARAPGRRRSASRDTGPARRSTPAATSTTTHRRASPARTRVSSRWRGRIAMLSNSRSAAAYGSASVTRTVCESTFVTVESACRRRRAGRDAARPIAGSSSTLNVNTTSSASNACAVREAQAASQRQRVGESVRRSLPGFRQRALGRLRQPVDVNEVSGHAADDVPRRRVGGEDRVERSGLGAKRDDETPAVVAGVATTRPAPLRPRPDGAGGVAAPADVHADGDGEENGSGDHPGPFVQRAWSARDIRARWRPARSAGASIHQYEVSTWYCWSVPSMPPQLAVGSPMPSPRKDSATSASRYCGMSTLAWVSTRP